MNSVGVFAERRGKCRSRQKSPPRRIAHIIIKEPNTQPPAQLYAAQAVFVIAFTPKEKAAKAASPPYAFAKNETKSSYVIDKERRS